MNDREYLAAEYALGLLEGADLLEARGLASSDVEFAAYVAAWEERLAPLFDEFGEEVPPVDVWNRVKAELDSEHGVDVVQLTRRVSWWKGTTAAASAIAASLALVIAFDVIRPPSPVPAPPVEQPAQAEVMVASLMSEDRSMMLSASWQSDQRELTVMPGNMPAEPGRSLELWIIPADGTPRSLGLIDPAGPGRMTVEENMAPYLAESATLAVSIEPEGGSPGPAPTGPVIASGALAKV
jgi:anti-sigma-K factor RskA